MSCAGEPVANELAHLWIVVDEQELDHHYLLATRSVALLHPDGHEGFVMWRAKRSTVDFWTAETSSGEPHERANVGAPRAEKALAVMLDALLGGSLRTRLVVLIAALTFAIGGYYAYQHLTIEAFPDPTDTQVQVITLFPGQPDRRGRAPRLDPARARAERHARPRCACAASRCSACRSSR